MPKGELVIKGQYEWFKEKSEINRKHGFEFDEILDMFEDPFFYEIIDSLHSDWTQIRYNGIGYSKGVLKVVQVAFTERSRIHIISARPATSGERKLYYERIREVFG